MNQEIYDIIDDMKGRCKANAIAESDKQTYLMVQSSRLSVLLAEEDAIRGKEVSNQTEKIIKLTKSIHFLTLVMVIVGIIQLYIAIFK